MLQSWLLTTKNLLCLITYHLYFLRINLLSNCHVIHYRRLRVTGYPFHMLCGCHPMSQISTLLSRTGPNGTFTPFSNTVTLHHLPLDRMIDKLPIEIIIKVLNESTGYDIARYRQVGTHHPSMGHS